MASSQAELSASARVPSPTDLKHLQGLDLQFRYYSARTGGDFFDALAVGPQVMFLLMDIAGRRLGAHAIAAEVQSAFRAGAQDLFSPPDANESEAIVKLVQEVNSALINACHGVHCAPAFIGCYNVSLAILTYINAGSSPAVFRDKDGTRLLESGGIPLGLFTHMPLEPAMQVFEPGAKLLLVTKGIVEARRGGAEFGMERVARLLRNSSTDSADEICQTTTQAAHEFRTSRWSWLRKADRVEDLTAVALVRPH